MLQPKYCLLVGTLAITCGQLAWAQSTAPEQIVVVSNRIPVPIKRVATSISVLDEAAIQVRGNVSLKDILRQTPAIGGSNYGGTGSLSSIRIRGEEGFRTLMIFDGMKLSDPSGTQVATPIEHVLSSGVGRVEILRGPQGLNYGADAGGVVSISSRMAEPGLAFTLDGQAGSFGTEQLSASVAAANDVGDFYLSASDFATDGYNARISDTVLSDKDGYDNQTYHTRIGYNIAESLRLELAHHNVESTSQYDGCFAGTTVYDCEAQYDLDATRLSANYTTDDYSHLLTYSRSDTRRDDRAQGVSAFGSEGEVARWEYTGSLKQLPGFDLVFGADLEQEQNGALHRDNEGYYLEVLSDFSEHLFLTAGVRQDRNDDFGNHQSYRISSAYLLDAGAGEFKFKASYGTGFRAPSLFEISYNSGTFAYPPASLTRLREETSTGFEFGIEYQSDSGLHLELVRFDQEIDDAIYFDLAGFSGYLQDIGASSSSGFEAIADYPLSAQLRLSANYTYNDTERPNGQQRLRRPEHLVNIGINYSGRSQRLALHGFYRMSQNAIDEVFGTTLPLEDTGVLDLGASYRLTDQIDVYARLENALNDEFEEVVDYRSPERASYIGIRVNF